MGFFSRLIDGMKKTKKSFSEKMKYIFTGNEIDEEFFEELQEKFPQKVKVIHKKNQGAMASRVCALQHAAGDIIWFIDSDDCIKENALEKLNVLFEKDKCDLVLFNASKYANFSKPMLELTDCAKKTLAQTDKIYLYELLITTRMLNSMCLKAMTREVATAIEQYNNLPFVRHGEDLLQSTAVLTKANKIACLDECLYFYRQREDSVVHTFNPDRHLSVKFVHQQIEKYIDIWGEQALHSKHYAREVQGWIECLKQLLNESDQIDKKRKALLIKELAEDLYFTNAYEKMSKGTLSGVDKLLAQILYHKCYCGLRFYGCAKAIVQKVR